MFFIKKALSEIPPKLPTNSCTYFKKIQFFNVCSLYDGKGKENIERFNIKFRRSFERDTMFPLQPRVEPTVHFPPIFCIRCLYKDKTKQQIHDESCNKPFNVYRKRESEFLLVYFMFYFLILNATKIYYTSNMLIL